MIARRRFLAWLSLGLGGLTGAIIGLPVVGFFFAPIARSRHLPRVWRSVGAVDQFAIGQTVEVSFQDSSPLPWSGQTAQTAAWLRRESANQFIAFTVNCSHLGCPVRWRPDANLFMCPCHGGVYYQDGQVAAGPPKRALGQYSVRIRGGQVEVLTSPIPIFAT